MEWILGFIICLQFAYIVYKDITVANEREKMFLKLMSKNVQEYKDSIETIADTSDKTETSTVIPVEDVSDERLLRAIK